MPRRTLNLAPMTAEQHQRIDFALQGNREMRSEILRYVASPLGHGTRTVTGARKMLAQKYFDVVGSESIQLSGRTVIDGCSVAFTQTLVALIQSQRLTLEPTAKGWALSRGELFPTNPTAF